MLSELLAMREQECQELEQWLSDYLQPDAAPMADHCGSEHGLQPQRRDLGLDTRQSLRELMQCCFPDLARVQPEYALEKILLSSAMCSGWKLRFAARPVGDECVEREGVFCAEE